MKKKALGVLLLWLVAATGFAEPLFRVGIVTDTHLNGNSPDPIERLRRAYRLFRDKKVALIANCGDFGCKFDPVAYGRDAAIRRETYPDPAAAPKEVYVWADHDWVGYPGAKGNEAWTRGFADVKRLLGIDHDMYARFALNGFEFLVFPEQADMTRYEREIAAAEKRAGVGRPVFVFEHAPAFGTTEASGDWGATNRLDVLSRHPQVIAVNGHSHGSLRNERNIWQGAFTSVSAGCLAHWMEQLPGVPGVRMHWSWGCLVMEVYPDRAVFRRYDLQETEEIGADAPWTVAWPHDPVRPRYSPARCAERAAKPFFPPQSRLVLRPDSTQAFERVEVSFPAAKPSDTVFCHRLKIERRDADGHWKVFASRDLRAEYHLPARQRRIELTDALTAAYFEGVDVCRVSVAPVDFWGNCGQPITTEWQVPPARPWKTVWEGVPEGCAKAVRFGWSGHWKLPDCVAEGLPKGAKLRVTADFALTQSERRGAILSIRGLDGGATAFTVRTPPGESDLRYAGEFVALDDKRQELSVRFGDGGRLVVRHLRLEMRP